MHLLQACSSGCLRLITLYLVLHVPSDILERLSMAIGKISQVSALMMESSMPASLPSAFTFIGCKADFPEFLIVIISSIVNVESD